MRKRRKEKAIVSGLVILFVFNAFLPVISSVEYPKEDFPIVEANKTTKNVTFTDFITIGYKIIADISFQPILGGILSVTLENPFFRTLSKPIPSQKTNTDVRRVDIDDSVINNEKISQELNDEMNGYEFHHPLNPSDSWWNTSWMYRKEIKINHTKVAASLTNFPVLISLASDTDLASHAQNDGDDIVFINNATGTKLNHEIELFNGDTGHFVAWVNVIQLSSATDVIIYMYYGNSVCNSMENNTGVWDVDYRIVQHLEETNGIDYDSTIYGNNGTCSGGVNQSIQGMIDGADGFDGNDDYVNCSNNNSLDITQKMSIEAWIKPDTIFTDRRRVLIHGTNTAAGYQLYTHNKKLAFSRCNSTNYTQSTLRETVGSSLTAGNWTYIAAIYDAGTFTIYVNGVSKSLIPGTLVDFGSGSNLLIGRHPDGYGFDGIIDEIRVSSTARNQSWITTCYNNQGNQTTFLSVGSEENHEADLVPPEISNVGRTTSNPLDTHPSFGWVNISCLVTDNIAVNRVSLNISNPDGSLNNNTMVLKGGGIYYYNSSTLFSVQGHYQYFIWANDTNGNINQTIYANFSMPPNWDINMDGVCNILDVTLLSTKWLQVGVLGWIREDINNDGSVNIGDVSILSIYWMQSWL